MKFALPDDLGNSVVMAVDQRPSIDTFDSSKGSSSNLPTDLAIDNRAFHARAVPIYPIVPRSVYSSPDDNIKSMQTAINDYTSHYIEQRRNESIERDMYTAELIQTVINLSQVNISKFNEQVDNRIESQRREVQDIIAKEKERIRLEQEEQERQRRLKEEARLKKLEEERRKKKEEEERKEKERQRIEAERKRKEEERQRKEEEKIRLEKEQQKALEAEELKKQQEKARNSNFTDFNSVEKEFYKYKNDIEDIKKNVKEQVNQNKELKRQVNTHKRKINPKFGQLSSSLSHTEQLTSEVLALVDPVKQFDDLAFKWILNYIAKAIVHQAETEVIVRPFAALPLAILANRLLTRYPEFEYFLSARFVKKCPYIIGFTDPMTTVEGRLRMNWKRFGENDWESEVKYDERVAGICTVWAVLSRMQSEHQEYGIFSNASSWQFAARTLNTNVLLLRNTHFELLANWWEAGAVQFQQVFGRQAIKIMKLMVIELTNAVADKKFPSAARLRLLGEEWLNSGRIKSLKEMEA